MGLLRQPPGLPRPQGASCPQTRAQGPVPPANLLQYVTGRGMDPQGAGQAAGLGSDAAEGPGGQRWGMEPSGWGSGVQGWRGRACVLAHAATLLPQQGHAEAPSAMQPSQPSSSRLSPLSIHPSLIQPPAPEGMGPCWRSQGGSQGTAACGPGGALGVSCCLQGAQGPGGTWWVSALWGDGLEGDPQPLCLPTDGPAAFQPEAQQRSGPTQHLLQQVHVRPR